MNDTMKALVKAESAPGLSLQAVKIPKIESNEVLIKVNKAAICGTDLHIYKWDEWARKTVPVPLTIGHEFMGEVVEIGHDVKESLSIGDRVSGEGHIVCGICRNCRAGNRHLCRNTQGIGYHRTGAFSEYFAMPAGNVCKIPDNINDNVAAMLDPIGNAVHTALTYDLVGEDVLITGAGPIGIMAAKIARHAGARHVVITDINPFRLEMARKNGIDTAINPVEMPLTDVMKALGMTEGFDVGMEMSGSSEAFSDMVAAMNHGGRIAYLGIPSLPFLVDWSDVIFKSLTISGIYGRRMFETWYRGIAMLQSGLDLEPVITHHFRLEEFEMAFDTMLSGQSGKIILDIC